MTSMHDLYLRAHSEADLITACPFLRGTNDEGVPVWITGTADYALSIIGPVVTTPGTYDDEGQEITPPVVDARFHANLRCTEAIAALVPPQVIVNPDPDNPVRVWL